MYTALKSDTNEIIFSYNHDKDTLKHYFERGIILCPDCGGLLNVRSGSKKQHFYHYKNNCTYKYHEPETEQHEEGKILLSDILIELFPDAKVQIEKKIPSTNQRSDVLVEHKNGDRWAFEFQCSKITSDIWTERHNLYKKAEIIDFWVLGDSLHSYGITQKKEDKLKHRLSGFEKALLEKNGRLFYLNVEKSIIRVLGQFKYEISNTMLKGKQYLNKISQISFKNNNWWMSQDELDYRIMIEKEHKRKYETDSEYRKKVDEDLYNKHMKPMTIEEFLEFFKKPKSKE
ncbi:competence protein CoiA [Clostridium butyricum]